MPLPCSSPEDEPKNAKSIASEEGAADRTRSVLNLGRNLMHLNTASHRHSLPRAASRLCLKRKYSINILVSRHANFSSRKIDFAKSGVMLELGGGKLDPRLHFVARRLAKRELSEVALRNAVKSVGFFVRNGYLYVQKDLLF